MLTRGGGQPRPQLATSYANPYQSTSQAYGSLPLFESVTAIVGAAMFAATTFPAPPWPQGSYSLTRAALLAALIL